MAAYRRVYDSLTAKNRDQLRNPTLGNRVRATFTRFTQRLCGRVGDVSTRIDIL